MRPLHPKTKHGLIRYRLFVKTPTSRSRGEYHGADAAPGAQVVALGKGRFDVQILDGGLPGAGGEPGRVIFRNIWIVPQ